MYVKFITTTRAKLSQLQVVNGQLIYLNDENAVYYDMGNERMLVNATREVNGLPLTGYPGLIYVDKSATPRATYIWDASASTPGFVQISGQIATANQFGLVKPDGTTITINNGVITSNTVTNVATGAGLTGGPISSTGTISAALASTAKSTLTAAAKGATSNKEYAVGLDSAGNLSVNIPWSNTTYSSKSAASGGTAVSLVTTGEKYTWNTKQNALTAGDNITISGSTISASYPAATTASAGLLSANDKIKLNNTNVYFGTCDTAADTARKDVTLTNATGFAQVAGTIIGVKFTNSNSASSCTIKVGSEEAASIYYNNAVYTGSSTNICGTADQTMYYMYDGSYWVWMAMGKLYSSTNTVPSAYCDTAAATADKTATCTGYQITLSNTYIHVIIANTNTYAGALTLSINSKTAKPIYLNGEATSATNYSLTRGSYLAYYDGTNYYFRTDGKLTGAGLVDINGNTTKFLRGDGTWQTPSGATYNVVSTDENGLAPKVTSTSGFLKGDGTWATPTNTKNTAGSTDTSSKIYLIGATSQAANPQTYSDDQVYTTSGTLTSNKISTKALMALSGTGTAGSTSADATPVYTPTLWTFDSAITVANGEVYLIKIPEAGGTYGVWLTLNNGTNYYPVAVGAAKARFTTHYSKNTVIAVTYESAGVCTCYPKAGGTSTSDVTGIFRVLNDYDANTTYSAMSTAELIAGTATSSRVVRADYLNAGINALIDDRGITTSVVSTASNGLAPKVTSTSGFLKGDGTWATPTDTVPSAYCETAAATAAKTATCTGYALLSKSYIQVIVKTTNTAKEALTLSINGATAKPIYINGTVTSSSNYSLTKGSYLVYYDGTNYYFRKDGKLTGAGVVNTSNTDLIGVSGVKGSSESSYRTGEVNITKANIGLDNVVNYTEVTGTLAASSTSITLSNAAITSSSTIDVYCSDPMSSYTGLTLATGSVTITWDSSTSSRNIKVRVY